MEALWLNKFATAKGKVLYIDEESSKALLQRRLKQAIKGQKFSKRILRGTFCHRPEFLFEQ